MEDIIENRWSLFDTVPNSVKALITGGCGFVGSHLSEFLL